MQAEPLIVWSEPAREYVGFVAQFVALGAVGFRFAAVRGNATSTTPDSTERAVYTDALQRAALLGLVGILGQSGMFALGLPKAAARAHQTIEQLLTTNLQTGSAALLFAVAVIGFLLASVRQGAAWPLTLAAIVAPLTGAFTGQWSRLVNPVHRVVAGLWIGTLFVLVVAGLSVILQEERTRQRRGAIAASMVNGFSPLALSCGMIVVASGLTTAWTHLNPLSSLWTTPYGYALLVKLALVAIVFGLGAWNWQRVRPTLGSEDAAHAVRRSARAELTAAALVLAVTAILVSLPSPKPAGAKPLPATPAVGP